MPSTTPDAPATRDYADADTKPSALSDAATPRTPAGIPTQGGASPAPAADLPTLKGNQHRH